MKRPCVIVKQSVAAHCSQKHVDETIVVVVAHGDARAVQLDIQPALGRDVAEMTAAVVLVKYAGRRGCGRARVPGPAAGIDQQQVLIAVVVVVEKRAAAAHRFRQQFLACGTVFVSEIDAGFLGDVSKRQLGNLDLRQHSGFGQAEGWALRHEGLPPAPISPDGHGHGGQHQTQHDDGQRDAERPADDRVVSRIQRVAQEPSPFTAFPASLRFKKGNRRDAGNAEEFSGGFRLLGSIHR